MWRVSVDVICMESPVLFCFSETAPTFPKHQSKPNAGCTGSVMKEFHFVTDLIAFSKLSQVFWVAFEMKFAWSGRCLHMSMMFQCTVEQLVCGKTASRTAAQVIAHCYCINIKEEQSNTCKIHLIFSNWQEKNKQKNPQPPVCLGKM